jgi:release factor glutamine methyltransferase
MDLSTYRTRFLHHLSTQYPSSELQAMLKILLKEVCPTDWMQRLSQPHLPLPEPVRSYLERAFEDLQTGRPFQYVVGKTWFDHLELEVAEGVLIPRPETEELVHLIDRQGRTLRDKELRILDVGTGSGCIAIALAKRFPRSEVIAWDFSDEAIRIAQRNAEKHLSGVQFCQQDVLQWKQTPREDWDIIVSNPPYITYAEYKDMETHVVDFEPRTALFVENEKPLLFYEAITQLAQERLKPGGFLYFEINAGFATEMKQLVANAGFDQVLVHPDMQGLPRMLSAIRLPNSITI